jgi:hypothetical protein
MEEIDEVVAAVSHRDYVLIFTKGGKVFQLSLNDFTRRAIVTRLTEVPLRDL